MDLSGINVYWLLIISSFFSGFGNLCSQYIWAEFLKPKIDKLHKRREEAEKITSPEKLGVFVSDLVENK